MSSSACNASRRVSLPECLECLLSGYCSSIGCCFQGLLAAHGVSLAAVLGRNDLRMAHASLSLASPDQKGVSLPACLLYSQHLCGLRESALQLRTALEFWRCKHSLRVMIDFLDRSPVKRNFLMMRMLTSASWKLSASLQGMRLKT